MEKVVAFASEKKGRELKKLNEIFNFHSMKLKRARKLFNFSMFPVASHARITHTRCGIGGISGMGKPNPFRVWRNKKFRLIKFNNDREC